MTTKWECAYECRHSEYSEYTSMTMCKLTKAPAWMTLNERECEPSIISKELRTESK